MRYNKNTYLQILKSFGILSSSFALCACGNFGNDFSTQHDDEKLSKTEIRDFVTSELENFESIDEDKKTEILNFFSSNVDFFQTKNDLRKLFSVVKNDLNVLDEFIRGEKLLANLDELVMQMNVEAVAHELDDVEKMATDDFEQATKQEIEALQLEQQKK